MIIVIFRIILTITILCTIYKFTHSKPLEYGNIIHLQDTTTTSSQMYDRFSLLAQAKKDTYFQGLTQNQTTWLIFITAPQIKLYVNPGKQQRIISDRT